MEKKRGEGRGGGRPAFSASWRIRRGERKKAMAKLMKEVENHGGDGQDDEDVGFAKTNDQGGNGQNNRQNDAVGG